MSKQLQIAPAIPETDAWFEEMMNLQTTPNSRHRDDPVPALGLALWQARKPEIGPNPGGSQEILLWPP